MPLQLCKGTILDCGATAVHYKDAVGRIDAAAAATDTAAKWSGEIDTEPVVTAFAKESAQMHTILPVAEAYGDI